MRNDQKSLADIYSRIITESNGRKVIKGDVDLDDLYLEELPDWLSDVEVRGGFYCSNNKLTTLAGAPETVGGTFSCSDNPGNFTEEDVRAVSDVDGEIYNYGAI